MKIDPKLTAIVEGYFACAPPDSANAIEAGLQLRMVEVDALKTGVQPRTDFDVDELRDLQNSIAELSQAGQGIGGTGILQPLLARPLEDGSLQLVAGERRLRAAKAAGCKTVPVVVGAALSEEQAYGQAIVENLLRADLSPLEEARSLRKWMDEAELSVRVAAKKLGRDKGYLENRLRLLSMKSDVQNMVSARKDTLPHARLIDAVDDDIKRAELIVMVTEQGAGKREIERIIAGGKMPLSASEQASSKPAPSRTEKQNYAEKSVDAEVKGALKSLKIASKNLQSDEALQLADALDKLAVRLRKSARATNS